MIICPRCAELECELEEARQERDRYRESDNNQRRARSQFADMLTQAEADRAHWKQRAEAAEAALESIEDVMDLQISDEEAVTRIDAIVDVALAAAKEE